MNIALRRFLHNHGNIATEGDPKPGLCPYTLISNLLNLTLWSLRQLTKQLASTKSGNTLISRLVPKATKQKNVSTIKVMETLWSPFFPLISMATNEKIALFYILLVIFYCLLIYIGHYIIYYYAGHNVRFNGMATCDNCTVYFRRRI